MTTEQAIAPKVKFPATVSVQELTEEDGEGNSTQALIMDVDLEERPLHGQRLDISLPMKGWHLEAKSCDWIVDGSHYRVSAELVRDDYEAMANEIEAVLKEAGFRVDVPLMMSMEIMEHPETEGMDFDQFTAYRDEQLAKIGYQPEPRAIDTTGWASVQMQVHLDDKTPLLILDTLMPHIPQTGDPIAVSEKVIEANSIGSVDSHSIPGTHVVSLQWQMGIVDYDRTEAGLRAAGFVDPPAN